MKKKRKFLSVLLSLVLIFGAITGNPVIVKADDSVPPAAFAEDNSSVTIQLYYASRVKEFTYPLSAEYRSLLDSWGDFNYTYIYVEHYSSQYNGYYWLIIYPKDTELRVFKTTNTAYVFAYGSVFEKDTITQVPCIQIVFDDLGSQGYLGNDDVEAKIINPSATSNFMVGRHTNKSMSDEEFATYFAERMRTTATVKNYNKDTLEIGSVYCPANITLSSSSGSDSNQEIQGSSNDSRTVMINCTLSSIYSVSLPAQIELQYQKLTDVYAGDATTLHSSTEGFFGNIISGAAGKIGSGEVVYIEPQWPCTMTGTSGTTLDLMKILPSTLVEPKTTWTSTEIGSCEFDGVSLRNCQYAYNDGMQVGLLLENIDIFETYTGQLTFNFGIRSN